MRYTLFGQRTGLRVSEIALGAGMFGTTFGYGAPPEQRAQMTGGRWDQIDHPERPVA